MTGVDCRSPVTTVPLLSDCARNRRAPHTAYLVSELQSHVAQAANADHSHTIALLHAVVAERRVGSNPCRESEREL